MTNNEILNEIKKLKQKLKELENKAQNLQENEYKRWRAEGEVKYYCLSRGGGIEQYIDSKQPIDNFLYSIGNYFKTSEEVEEYKENLITKQKLKDLALRLNKNQEFNWEDCSQDKFFIAFCHEENDLKQYHNITLQNLNQIYCLDAEFLYIAKQEIGKEALIKLIKSGV